MTKKWVKNDLNDESNLPTFGSLLNHLFTAESYLNWFKTGVKKWVKNDPLL